MGNGIYSGVPSAIHTRVVSCTHVLLLLILCPFVLFSLTNPRGYFMQHTCTASATSRVTDTKLCYDFRMLYLISSYGAWRYIKQSHFSNRWKFERFVAFFMSQVWPPFGTFPHVETFNYDPPPPPPPPQKKKKIRSKLWIFHTSTLPYNIYLTLYILNSEEWNYERDWQLTF